MMKKSIGMGVMLAALMVPASLFASIIVDSDDDPSVDFALSTGGVHSWVEDSPTTGYYRYFYEILEPGVNIQWFSVELLDDAIVASLKTVTGTGGDPAMWSVVGAGDSVDAFFTSPITPTNDSLVIWFDSPQSYTVVDGMASGITGGVYQAFSGLLYSPIPEPMTMVLLAVGGVCAMRRKRN